MYPWSNYTDQVTKQASAEPPTQLPATQYQLDPSAAPYQHPPTASSTTAAKYYTNPSATPAQYQHTSSASKYQQAEPSAQYQQSEQPAARFQRALAPAAAAHYQADPAAIPVQQYTQQYPTTDQQYPNTDQQYPTTDQQYPTTDQQYPTTDQYYTEEQARYYTEWATYQSGAHQSDVYQSSTDQHSAYQNGVGQSGAYYPNEYTASNNAHVQGYTDQAEETGFFPPAPPEAPPSEAAPPAPSEAPLPGPVSHIPLTGPVTSAVEEQLRRMKEATVTGSATLNLVPSPQIHIPSPYAPAPPSSGSAVPPRSPRRDMFSVSSILNAGEDRAKSPKKGRRRARRKRKASAEQETVASTATQKQPLNNLGDPHPSRQFPNPVEQMSQRTVVNLNLAPSVPQSEQNLFQGDPAHQRYSPDLSSNLLNTAHAPHHRSLGRSGQQDDIDGEQLDIEMEISDSEERSETKTDSKTETDQIGEFPAEFKVVVVPSGDVDIVYPPKKSDLWKGVWIRHMASPFADSQLEDVLGHIPVPDLPALSNPFHPREVDPRRIVPGHRYSLWLDPKDFDYICLRRLYRVEPTPEFPTSYRGFCSGHGILRVRARDAFYDSPVSRDPTNKDFRVLLRKALPHAAPPELALTASKPVLTNLLVASIQLNSGSNKTCHRKYPDCRVKMVVFPHLIHPVFGEITFPLDEELKQTFENFVFHMKPLDIFNVPDRAELKGQEFLSLPKRNARLYRLES